MPTTLPPRIKNCPSSGAGVHRWIFHAVCVLDKAGYADADIEEWVGKHSSRSLQPGEVQNALKTIRNSIVKVRPRWPFPNPIDTKRIANLGGGMDALRRTSVVECADAGDALQQLFEGDPLLCCGLDSREFATEPLSRWINLSQLQFIVPSPMSDKWGETQAGKRSQHTLSNTGPRHYLVVEFDEGSHDSHASIIQHLAAAMPLCMAVDSGGKSIHAWFDVRERSEASTRRFFQLACQLGADPATWTKSQFVRMPQGRRANGNLQKIIHFNPPKYAPF
jgi:hypothetical protein